LQPKSLEKLVLKELEKWGTIAVLGHFTGTWPWLTIDEIVFEQTATIVGGKIIEVAIMNSLTVNLNIGMLAFYRPTEKRYKILVEARAFPSDAYAVTCHIRFHGYDPEQATLVIPERFGDNLPSTNDILKIIEENGEEIALVMLPGIQYETGQLFDMEKITAAAHKKGCFVGWDLAHAIGNVELKLHDWEVDFACWCSYKYLNAGPGGIGGFFLHEKHAYNQEIPRLGGWWAQNLSTRFQFQAPWDPIPGASGFRNSNPCVLAVVSLYSSLEIFVRAGMSKFRKKSLLLTGYLEILIKTLQDQGYFKIVTPTDPSQRGCQLSLRFNRTEDVKELEEKLRDEGVICDVRGVNMRVAPIPLYNTFSEVRDFVDILTKILLKSPTNNAENK